MLDVITDPDILAGYLTDASNIPGTAEALVRPRSTAEVAEVVARCQRSGTPLTVTARRTSTTGGPVPRGGWLLSTEHLDRILEIGERTATAEGGVLLGDLQDAVESRGRLYPPDPTSRRECSLGASIACNASGARSFRYGPTRPWVQSVEVVLPDGQIVEADRDTPIPADWPVPRWEEPAVKTAAGYFPADNLLDLFIGQEGTLGIITRATVKLTELPAEVFSVLCFFPDLERALAFVERARGGAGGVSPRLIEFYDHASLGLIRAREPGIPEGAAAAIWCEQESRPEDEDALLEAWLGLIEAATPLAADTLFAQDGPSLERLHRMRHAVPAGVNEIVVRNGMPKVGTDCSVPHAALPEMMRAYADAPVAGVLFGHIGDSHLHLNMLPADAAQLAAAKAYYRDLCHKAVALGGSVSAEHGIGKIKRAHLADMVGPEVIAGFRALKSRLDPSWILGRGNLLDPTV
jgi:D-lactate dehydrogenase (cytochrome)